MGTHSDSLVPAMPPPRTRGGGYGSSKGAKTAPNLTYSATVSTQAQDPHSKPRLRGTKWQRRGPSAEECECELCLGPQPNPGPAKPAEAKTQQTPNNKHIHTQKTIHRDSHRSKVTRSTSTLRLHKNLTRHGQHHGTGKTEAGRAKE